MFSKINVTLKFSEGEECELAEEREKQNKIAPTWGRGAEAVEYSKIVIMLIMKDFEPQLRANRRITKGQLWDSSSA